MVSGMILGYLIGYLLFKNPLIGYPRLNLIDVGFGLLGWVVVHFIFISIGIALIPDISNLYLGIIEFYLPLIGVIVSIALRRKYSMSKSENDDLI